MKLGFKGVDISTEEKFIRYIESLNKEIMKRNAKTEGPKEPLYDIKYLRKRYRRIVAKEKKAMFMAPPITGTQHNNNNIKMYLSN